MIRKLLTRVRGSDRAKVIAVFGADRCEVERAVRHARGGSELPVWAWCASADALPVDGCELFLCGPDAWPAFRVALRTRWIALSIVCWTGRRESCRLWPLTIPPFRTLIMNEAGDFFVARPVPVARHLERRLHEGCAATIQRAGDWVKAGFGLLWSLAYRTGQRIRDVFFLAISLAWRAAQWVRDSAVLARNAALSRLQGLVHLGSEIVLAGLAAFARLTPRLAVVLLAEQTRHAAVSPPPVADSFIEIARSGRGWNRRSVVRQLRSSNAAFVVFRCDEEPGDARALIAMALATGAFAVARQMAHSAWRERVVAKHPFRRLNEGEVTEVAAPYSSLIAMRRETLLCLGCPSAFTWGAALMLIFREAASAGRKAFVMGHGGAVPDEPAMALEDLEFALRVRLSRVRFRKDAPALSEQLRGNIAWSPWHRRAMRDRKRVLVLSPYLPFPLSHGGAVRIYNLCREMAGEIDFILACFREANETVHYDELHEVFREVYVVDADETHTAQDLPAQVAEYRNSAMAGLIRRLCEERQVDIVQLEYTQMAEYAACVDDKPVVLVEHDITLTLYRQMAAHTGDIATRREYVRWLAFEERALEGASAVWTMSGHDRATAIQHGAAAAKTVVIPNGVDLWRYTPEAKMPHGENQARVVLFIGSFRHRPNLMAFEELRRNIMPEVWRMCPDVTLHVIAGTDYEKAARSAQRGHLLSPDPRIVVEGFVADVRPAYRLSDVVAIPLPVSAGTNIKLMEAMASGRAVVSSAIGCHGLDLTSGRELIVAEIGLDFSRALVALLNEESLRDNIALNARAMAEQRFGWDAIARRALDSYAGLTPQQDTIQAGPVRAWANS